MNATYTARIENADGLAHAALINLKNVVASAATFTSLDHAENVLRAQFPGWFVYRGGSHVSLHAFGDNRVLIVEERELAPTPDPMGPTEGDLAAEDGGQAHTPARTTLGSFVSLKSAVTVARTEAHREARVEGRKLTRKTFTGQVVPWPHKFVRSRGTSLVALDARGRCRAFDEPWQWDGTKAQLLDALRVALAETPEADSLELFGGFDLSETFDFNDYEPEFTSWSVTVWTRSGGWQF